MTKKQPTIRDLEGSISVNGDITPITRKPVGQMDSSRWGEMTLLELSDQREILVNRIAVANSIGGALALQLERGLRHLEALMAQRAESIEETYLV